MFKEFASEQCYSLKERALRRSV